MAVAQVSCSLSGAEEEGTLLFHSASPKTVRNWRCGHGTTTSAPQKLRQAGESRI